MVVKPKPSMPSQRRVPDVRLFKKGKYHPQCYISQEEAKAKAMDETYKKVGIPPEDTNKVPLVSHDLIRTIVLPGDDPKTKKAVFDQELFDKLKARAKVSYLVL